MQAILQVAFRGSKPFFPREVTLPNACALRGAKELLLSFGFIMMLPLKLLMKLPLPYALGKRNCNSLNYFSILSNSQFHSHLNEKTLGGGNQRKIIGPQFTLYREVQL